ncbi:MAG: polymer-forming cytoskeletal protein, partial [candidate division Zixibacteria bacterium]|nr:polymer-forming cytoskeletal protein [candidate division Zixibacteria bacterium]
MLRPTAIAAIISLSLLTSAGAPGRVYAQDSASLSKSSQDIVFHELYLSSEGVVGTDTSGQVWQYDFGQGAFEKSTGTASSGGPRSGTQQPTETEKLPVEVRCTEEIRLKPFERKSITIGAEEYVDGDITVYGRVSVRGWVKGNVVSFMGPVTVYETGRVDGDISSPEIIVKR